jgi:hypothetical protein
MTTGIPGSTARRNTTQQVGYLRFAVNFNDTGIAAGVNKQWLPAGAVITDTSVMIATAFNAGTTNGLTVGLTPIGSSPDVGGTAVTNNVVAAGQVAPGTIALTNGIVPTGAALGPLATDAQINVTYTQTGAAATAGQAIVMIKYIPNNDL